MSHILVISTTNSHENAVEIANHLLDKKLAACIQIQGPIESHYRWKDKHEISTEHILHIKTRLALYKEVEKEILSIHPYETPEIVYMPINGGFKDYLDWVAGETR